MAEGRRFVTNQPEVKAARKRAGYIGGIAAKEITYGSNGFNGLSLGHGVQVEQVDIGGPVLANYIAKARKGLDIRLSAAHELTHADLKSGRFGSVTPFELAAGYVETGEVALLGLWHEYEQATFNKSVLRFTQGLKQELKLYEEIHRDEELVAQDVGGTKAVLFKSSLYRQIVRIPALEGKVLTVLDTGGFDALTELLQTYHLDEPDSYWEVWGMNDNTSGRTAEQSKPDPFTFVLLIQAYNRGEIGLDELMRQTREVARAIIAYSMNE